MKVYIVHEYGGEWSDAWDSILGVFTVLEKAQELRNRKKKESDECVRKIELANKVYEDELTLKQSGLTKEEYEYYQGSCYVDDHTGFYITEITLDEEDVGRHMER